MIESPIQYTKVSKIENNTLATQHNETITQIYNDMNRHSTREETKKNDDQLRLNDTRDDFHYLSDNEDK